jgi:ubiquinone/menaquinone biosynthesis C-methylase UbiE
VTVLSGYDPARITAGGVAGEVARLAAQAALTFDEELRILRELGLPERDPLVDIGCGTGEVTGRLRAACPGLRVAGVDASLTLLAHARSRGIPVAGGSAGRLPLRSGSAGSVLLRYVLQHLPAPEPALAEARRVLRPGGLLAVVEVDEALWGLAQPMFPEIEVIHRKAALARRGTGTNRQVVRELPRLLRRAGFTGVVVRPFAVTNDQVPTDSFAAHLGPGQFAPLVADGALTLADLSVAAGVWNRFRADPDAWVLLLGLVIAGYAPGSPDRTPGRTT